jgi:hypothetical protein
MQACSARLAESREPRCAHACFAARQTNGVWPEWAPFGGQSILSDETLATLAEVTRRLKAATTQKFPRAKLADDGTRFGPGQPVVMPTVYKAEIIAQYRQMEFDGLVEDADAMANTTIVERKARRSAPARRAVGTLPGQGLVHRRAAQSVPSAVRRGEPAVPATIAA